MNLTALFSLHEFAAMKKGCILAMADDEAELMLIQDALPEDPPDQPSVGLAYSSGPNNEDEWMWVDDCGTPTLNSSTPMVVPTENQVLATTPSNKIHVRKSFSRVYSHL